MQNMIVDAHCHVGSGDGLTGPWDTRADIGPYLPRARAAGITHAVLFAAFNSDYRSANREVAAIVRSQPSRFWGFAFVNAETDRGRVELLVREARLQYGFVGIKVHRHDARITREVCNAARRYRVPVLYDVMGEVSVVDLIATEYPDVAFIIPHLGSFADDWRAQKAFLDPLARLRNVYTDTSGVRRFDLLAEAVRRAGPHKILFGSDGPWLHPGVELAKVWALELPPAAHRLVVAGNFLRLTRHLRAVAPAQHGAQTATDVSTAPLRTAAAQSDPWLPRSGEPDLYGVR
jgi:predicted TIM-barrel fold metal-dependent hydrolase